LKLPRSGGGGGVLLAAECSKPFAARSPLGLKLGGQHGGPVATFRAHGLELLLPPLATRAELLELYLVLGLALAEPVLVLGAERLLAVLGVGSQLVDQLLVLTRGEPEQLLRCGHPALGVHVGSVGVGDRPLQLQPLLLQLLLERGHPQLRGAGFERSHVIELAPVLRLSELGQLKLALTA
jgi:hypothetical protein